MKTVSTINASIYVGRREGYTWKVHSLDEAKVWLHEYCDRVGFCVTVTETEFIYSKGGEPGFIVGIINYPRFPIEFRVLQDHAFTIAKGLMKLMGQQKVTVVFDGNVGETVMFTEEDLNDGLAEAA